MKQCYEGLADKWLCVCVCVCVCVHAHACAQLCPTPYHPLQENFSTQELSPPLSHLLHIHQGHLGRLTNSYRATKITWWNLCILLAMEHFIDFAQITSTSFLSYVLAFFSRDLKLSVSQEELADSPTARAMWHILSTPKSNTLLSEIQHSVPTRSLGLRTNPPMTIKVLSEGGLCVSPPGLSWPSVKIVFHFLCCLDFILAFSSPSFTSPSPSTHTRHRSTSVLILTFSKILLFKLGLMDHLLLNHLESLLTIQTFEPNAKLLNQINWGKGPEICILNKMPCWVWCTAKFEISCSIISVNPFLFTQFPSDSLIPLA